MGKSKLIPNGDFLKNSLTTYVELKFISRLRTLFHCDIIGIDANEKQAGVAIMHSNGYCEKIQTLEWSVLHDVLPRLIFPTRFDCEDKVLRYLERLLMIGMNLPPQCLGLEMAKASKRYMNRGAETTYNFLREIGNIHLYAGAIVSTW